MGKYKVKKEFKFKDADYSLDSVVFYDRVTGFTVDELKVTDILNREVTDIHVVDRARDVSCNQASVIMGESFNARI